MWFFMYLCYGLTLLCLGLFSTSGLQALFHFSIVQANYATFLLLSVIVYLFTQTLVIFFFVGTGVSIKEYVQEKKADAVFYQQALQIKRRLYPALLLNVLFFMTTAVSIGAVGADLVPLWAHGGLFCLSFLHFLKVIWMEHQAFQENTGLILKMAGIQKEG